MMPMTWSASSWRKIGNRIGYARSPQKTLCIGQACVEATKRNQRCAYNNGDREKAYEALMLGRTESEVDGAPCPVLAALTAAGAPQRGRQAAD